MSTAKVLPAFVLSVLAINCAIQSTNAYKTKATLLHFNDINSQLKKFEQDNPLQPGEWGGFDSLIGLLKAEQDKAENPIRIAAGNLIGGETGWLSLVGWQNFGRLVENFYKPHVMGLGFKEFEAGLNLTNQYLDEWKKDSCVLVNNANCKPAEPFKPDSTEKKFCTIIKPYKLVSLTSSANPSMPIGILGFVNPLVEKLADPDSLTFGQDVAAALQKLLDEDKDLKDIKTFIAVGSGTMDIAKDILTKVKKVKIVVLSGGTNQTEYPTQFGDGGLIVKAGPYGKTFGKLVVEIDSDTGNVNHVKGESKLVDNKGGVDPAALKEVGDLETHYIADAVKNVIGHSLVKLEGTRDKCWRGECNLGNLICDAMVHCALSKELLKHQDLAAMIGIWTSGSIFNDAHLAGLNITEFDIHKILPYHNRAYVVKVTGKTLKTIFQTSGTGINAPTDKSVKDWGQFLQVSSGVEVHYGTDGSLKSLRVHKLTDAQPVMNEVTDTAEYDVVLPSFMFRGRSVYDYIPDNLQSIGPYKRIDIGFDDTCVHNYIDGLKVLSVGFEQRITISDDDGPNCSKCSGSSTGVTVFLTLLIFVLIVGLVYVGWRFIWPRISQRGHTSHFP